MKKLYLKLQTLWVDEINLKIGDRVKVVAKAASSQNGWLNSWTTTMSDSVGKAFTVTRIDNFGIQLDNRFTYPYFVLEKEPECIKIQANSSSVMIKVSEVGIRIGTTLISFEKFDEITKAVEKLRPLRIGLKLPFYDVKIGEYIKWTDDGEIYLRTHNGVQVLRDTAALKKNQFYPYPIESYKVFITEKPDYAD